MHREDIFTYHSEDTIAVGTIVKVEVGKKETIGVVVGEVKKPSFATKPVLATVEDRPLPGAIIELAEWLAEYYATPLASVWQAILPSGITKKRRKAKPTSTGVQRHSSDITFTAEQKSALHAIEHSPATTQVLQGVTGSGKTAVYIELAKKNFAANKSVIIIVPEIALTAQLISEFQQHFDDIIVTHSKMTEAARHTAWKKAFDNASPSLVIGPRSALFMPLKTIGLIVIDEAHEPSLKQEQAPRYSALRVGAVLAKLHHAKLILGSATPSISDRYLAEQTEGGLIRMDTPAKEIGAVTKHVIDSRDRHAFTRHRFLSNELLGSIEETLAKNEQVLIFHNRRGSAPTTLCENCGWSAECSQCHIPQVLHADAFSLLCHVCGESRKVPMQCPSCHKTDIIHKGIGTKLVHEELQKLYPNKKVVRFDQDNDAENTLEKRYQEVYDGDVDIIIGTQIIAKGLDLPHLSLVGIVQADSGLALPDFSSTERVFQLLYQVSGRVGRHEKPTKIVLQTYQPEHPAIHYAIQKDYDEFYRVTLEKRRKDHFPPFSFLLKLTCTYASEASAARAARALKHTLQTHATTRVVLLGPTPAFYERTRRGYRWQLVVRSIKRQDLVDLLPHVPTTHWQYELDPVSLLS